MIKVRFCRSIISVFFLLFFIGGSSTFARAKEIPSIEPFEKTDRVLILAPHPDDDIIGCAGVTQRALKAGAKVKVVYMTCGDNNIFSIVFYNKFLFPVRLIFLRNSDFINLGNQRISESKNAMKMLGVKEEDLLFLGYPDHGTDQMFVFNWDHTKPYRSSFSGKSSVPYKGSAGYKKEFTADNIIEDLKRAISDFKPNKIFVSHPSDVNGDHWAYYLYMMISLADLGNKIPETKIYPYIVHVPGWPLPRHYHPDLVIEPPEKFFGDVLPVVDWHQLKLTPEEINKKHEAMSAHKSQTRISAFYLMSFVRQNELFGDFSYIALKKQRSSELSAKPGEKDIFTADMQWVGYAVVDDSLWIRVKKPKELKQRLAFLFFIAGYRNDVPFANMPNILVFTRYNKFRILNATEDKYINPEGASLEVNKESAIFKIPLSVLGNPEGLLFAFETSAKFLPAGCTAFRVITIE